MPKIFLSYHKGLVFSQKKISKFKFFINFGTILKKMTKNG